MSCIFLYLIQQFFHVGKNTLWAVNSVFGYKDDIVQQQLQKLTNFDSSRELHAMTPLLFSIYFC